MDQLAQQLMMLDIDGILTRYGATTADVLAAAQQMAVSAIGNLVNNGQCSMVRSTSGRSQGENGQCSMVNGQCSMVNGHSLADAIADQIRAALHARIDEGKRPDW